MKEPLTFTPEAVGQRLDKWLAEQDTLDLTRSVIQTRMEQGDVTVNGAAVSKNYKIRSGDVVQVVIPEPVSLELVPEPIPLDIVYEDDDLLVVNKPKGMVVHPAPGNLTGTLVHALLYHCGDRLSGINGVIRPGIVHRIDKNTSGLLMVAKNDHAHLKLSEPIHAPIGRHPVDRKKMCVTQKNSKDAITHYTVLAESGNYTHLRLQLETGRTHQIRVHLAYLGHPVLGDDVYGKPFPNLTGQCLHAGKIGFIHPTTGEYMEFTSPLPDYFQAALRKLRFTEAEGMVQP